MKINFFRSYKTEKEKKLIKKELLLGLVSGAFLGLSFPPIPLPYFIFVGLIPYLMVIERRNGLAEINRFTYFTAFIFNIITLYWVGSWTPDADPFLMIAGTVLMFFNPIVFLIPSTIYYFARKYISRNLALYLLPWFWLFYEYIYSISDFKFPWLSLSNALPYFLSYIQIADVIGSYGLTILIIYVNIFGYLTLKYLMTDSKLNVFYLSLFILLVILPIVYGSFQLNTDSDNIKKIKVGLVQPNLNPNKKWEIGNLSKQIDLYEKLSTEAIKDAAEIVIWPETALPVYLMNDRYIEHSIRIQQFVDSSRIPILTGMPHAILYRNVEDAPNDAKPMQNSKGAYTSYNSILFFSPDTKVKQYGKIKLVPFGEKVPLVDIFPILGKWIRWNVGISSWNTGKDTIVFDWVNSLTQNIKVAGVICIESIYPDFVSSFVRKDADFIAVVTNDSWYGNSSGPYQHKEMSVLRAVENRRSVVRTANGGISCVIDPNGKTTISSSMFEQKVIVSDVVIMNGLTFFTRYPLLFPTVSILVVIFTILISIINKFRGIYSK